MVGTGLTLDSGRAPNEETAMTRHFALLAATLAAFALLGPTAGGLV